MTFLEKIDQPTLLIDEAVTRRNIRRMVQKAREKGVAFRPHFKTHQSAQVAEWFRAEGVERITVSSVEMAEYFANHSWKDILIAFSTNLRQVNRINALAERIHLEVLVENSEALQVLSTKGYAALVVWIKIDVGNGRTGVDWQNSDEVWTLCEEIQKDLHLKLAGLLTHSGHTYHAADQNDVIKIFREGVERLTGLRRGLEKAGIEGLKISVGDTPGCSLCEDWSGIDEVRPGNFAFYDIQQAAAGVCKFEDVSVALACPVVAKHPERSEIVVYGGAIHLSKDYLTLDGKTTYGLPALAQGERWGAPIPGGRVDRLSQEHGILQLPPEVINEIKVGDLVFVIPAHSCLTVQVMREYYTLKGEKISTLNQSK
jgi:D-serine deaminase-like pyridoxal phosphate-dependent protein